MLTVNQCLDQLRRQHDVVVEINCNYDSINLAKIDLYSQLKQVYKKSYEINQRLIFVLEKDFYNCDSVAGSLLKAIQIILQDIDISNFFVCIVTTNADIDYEYQYIQKNISADPVNFHIYNCQGEFSKIVVDHTALEGKIQSFKDIDIAKLTDQQKNLLFVDKVFCMIPWTGIHIDTTSEVYPCCEFNKNHSIGNAKNTDVDEIWNSPKMKSIRKNMLSGKSSDACKSCYVKEQVKQNSLRINFNREFADNINVIDQTDNTGAVPASNIKHWDIRYNNLCNFACRSCNPSASSSWYQVHNSIHPDKKLTAPLLVAGGDQDRVFDQLKKNINQVSTIYFAGGEPSMIENFYKILELLITHNRTDVELRYNLNMSRLNLKDKSLLDLWRHFTHVSVGASLDAENSRAVYLRVGTVWEDIVKNRLLIANDCPHVDFWISATTGLINALHVPDFHRSWVDNNYIKADDFNIQILLTPAYQSVINAPDLLKQKIIEKYTAHLAWLRPLDKTGRAVQGFNSIIELCQQAGHYDPSVFWHEINKLDQYHNTNLLETFPELLNVGL